MSKRPLYLDFCFEGFKVSANVVNDHVTDFKLYNILCQKIGKMNPEKFQNIFVIIYFMPNVTTHIKCILLLDSLFY